MFTLKQLPLPVLEAQLAACQAELHTRLGPCQLRLLETDDIPALLGLERYCFSPRLAFGRRRWRNLLAHSGCQTVGLWQGEQLLAYLCLFPHLGWQALEVRCLAVHWHVRRRGVAAALMGLAQGLGQDIGALSLRLEVDADNPAACQLYAGLQFVPVRHLPDYYGEGRHGQRLMRALEGAHGVPGV